MENKYNRNRHLCKKIDKLEDFTVEYKNDPFKALKLFIDAYLYFWYDAKFMSKDFPLGMPRGLICYKTGKEYCDDAQKKLDSKAEHL